LRALSLLVVPVALVAHAQELPLIHVAQVGDSLLSIASARGIAYETILRLNPVIAKRGLEVGDKVLLQEPPTETLAVPQSVPSPAADGPVSPAPAGEESAESQQLPVTMVATSGDELPAQRGLVLQSGKEARIRPDVPVRINIPRVFANPEAGKPFQPGSPLAPGTKRSAVKGMEFEEAVGRLPWIQGGERSRDQWTEGQRGLVGAIEDQEVEVTGFLGGGRWSATRGLEGFVFVLRSEPATTAASVGVIAPAQTLPSKVDIPMVEAVLRSDLLVKVRGWFRWTHGPDPRKFAWILVAEDVSIKETTTGPEVPLALLAVPSEQIQEVQKDLGAAGPRSSGAGNAR